MTNHEPVLTPSGRLLLLENSAGAAAPETSAKWLRKVVAAFQSSSAEGLFSLTATGPGGPLSPQFSFWRDFAGGYLSELCRIPGESAGASLDPIEPPGDAELAELLLSAPPMRGGEYLSAGVFRSLWEELDAWVRQDVAAFSSAAAAASSASAPAGLNEWLKARAPVWHQVGRVCFHLAENKRDSDYPFAFLATYAPRLSTSGRVSYQPLGKALQEYAGQRNKPALVKLLSPVQRAAEKIEFVGELVESGDVFHPLAWTPAEAYRLLKNAPLLEESGLLVRLPDWWRRRPRPRVSVTVGEKPGGRFGADAMLDFQVGLALGDQNLTEKEWRRIMASDDGLAFIKGQWIEVDREKLSEALEHWKQVEAGAAGDGFTFIEGMRLLAGAPADLGADDAEGDEEKEWSFVRAGDWLSEILTGLRDPESLAASGGFEDFQGTLRPYQETGCHWLRFLSELGLGACLADDMGLGKTIQVLSFLLSAKKEKTAREKRPPSLLVMPASLLANWKAEIERFAPTLKCRFVHPSETDKETLAALSRKIGRGGTDIDLVLTTYGMLLRQKWLLEIDWRTVILDEAQAIKNPAARQTKAVKRLRARSRIALTGTPVENRLTDLWSLFDFLSPGLLGSAAKFKTFVKGLNEQGHGQYAPLRNLVRPYILRRLKTDKSIIADLPDKTEVKAFCGLAKRQGAVYAKSVEALREALEGDADGIQRRGLVLSFLMRFKQICNHPSQFLGDGEYDPDDSGKFGRLGALCEEIASRQEKVLVFTQFREMTGPLADFLTGVFGREGAVLHGGTPVKKRRSLVEAFQREDGPPWFVLSIKAGGTGLNLTAASHVIHFDRWWNPAVEKQATDRAFRIGQQRNVMVHKFICRGTVEEKIDALIDEKSGLAGDILSGGAESMLTEMSNEALIDIVTLNIEQAEI